MTVRVRLGDVVAALEAAWPPALAQDWDAVGLVCGDPDAEVAHAVVAVDPTAATVAETLEADAGLLLTHHPLLLRGVHGVPADDPLGGLVHRLLSGGAALYCAHTNADAARPGVSDALAAALGLTAGVPLAPHTAADAGPAGRGIGRVCTLDEPEPLATFVRRVADALPATVWGVRAAGDPQRAVRSVAVSGGSGDGMLAAARAAGVDAYLTADLRHHPADTHLRHPGAPALVDVAHWASERPWCDHAAEVLRTLGLPVRVSDVRTDPWTLAAVPTDAPGPAPDALPPDPATPDPATPDPATPDPAPPGPLPQGVATS